VGVPARRIGWVCQCGEMLGEVSVGESLYCRACASSYVRSGVDELRPEPRTE
jgi:hypothetical protein